jgi:hypothetical protein
MVRQRGTMVRHNVDRLFLTLFDNGFSILSAREPHVLLNYIKHMDIWSLVRPITN